MKFLVTVTLHNKGKAIVEAPTHEAVELWIAKERAAHFRDWSLPGSLECHLTELVGGIHGTDIRVDADGEEV